MTKQMVKQTIAQLYRNQENTLLVNSYDEFDWEQLLNQDSSSQDSMNELFGAEYLLEDTDRDYIRCN
jgi:hypothetical protein